MINKLRLVFLNRRCYNNFFKMKKLKLFFLIFFLFLNGCSKESKKVYLPYSLSKTINSILVLPFETYSEESETTFYLPVKKVIAGEVEPHGKTIMNNILKKELSKYSSYYNFIFLSQNEFENLIAEILEETKNSEEIIKKLSQKTNTQAILYGKIYRFKERVGSAFSIAEPSSVAFSLILYNGKSGEILWMEEFDETQRPLSENVFNIQIYGKFKWLTAEELAERGLIKVFKTFPLK